MPLPPQYSDRPGHVLSEAILPRPQLLVQGRFSAWVLQIHSQLFRVLEIVLQKERADLGSPQKLLARSKVQSLVERRDGFALNSNGGTYWGSYWAADWMFYCPISFPISSLIRSPIMPVGSWSAGQFFPRPSLPPPSSCGASSYDAFSIMSC